MTPQELRASILQHAIQGKLVEQRSEEGTGEELFQQIQSEKQVLIKAGKIKKGKSLPPINDDDVLFEIPINWKWVRLGDLIRMIGGVSYNKNDVCKKGIRILRGGNIQNMQVLIDEDDVFLPPEYLEEEKRVQPCDILIVASTGSKTVIGKAGYVERPIPDTMIGAFLRICRPFSLALAAYLKIIFDSDFYRKHIRDLAQGTNINNVKESYITEFAIPLPPLAEQKRIAAKLEEILPLIDRYEAAWNKLEERNKRFPGDMQKSILQLAIQGKLVEQRTEEGTGEELFQQIQAEKQALIKAGKIKKEKPLPEIAENEIPFDIPDGWKWVRLIDLCKNISDGDHLPPPQVPNGIPFLVISNVSSGTIDFSNTRYVPKDYFESLSDERIAENGDVLFTVTGSYGIPVKVDCNERFCFQRHIALLKLLIDWDYLFYVLKSPAIKSQCDATATGTAQKTVGLKSLRSMLLPLPPLAEQKRIVTKLEEVLPLCERLK